MSSDNPYTVLGLAPGASEDEVKKAYRKFAMANHPDRNPGDKAAEERFKAINDANDKIKKGWQPGQENPFQGRPSGQWGFSGDPFAGGSPFNSFDDIFSAFHAQNRQRNRDIEAQVVISLEDAFNGGEITININSNGSQRNVRVQIPRGSDTGTQIRVAQAGDASFSAFKPGDLILSIRLNPHAKFKRSGDSLVTTANIDVFDLLLGGTLLLTGIDGHEMSAHIPAGTKPSNQIRLAGMGMPDLHTGKRGDLIVIPEVTLPNLTPTEQAQLAIFRDSITSKSARAI